jgi:hypothetical protein
MSLMLFKKVKGKSKSSFLADAWQPGYFGNGILDEFGREIHKSGN